MDKLSQPEFFDFELYKTSKGRWIAKSKYYPSFETAECETRDETLNQVKEHYLGYYRKDDFVPEDIVIQIHETPENPDLIHVAHCELELRLKLTKEILEKGYK